MSYGTDIKALFDADSSLNAAVQDVNYEHLPDNFDLTKDWVVYSFRVSGQSDCIDNKKNVFQNYELVVRVISDSTFKRESLSDYIVDLLNGNSYGGIKDIFFTSSSPTMDQEKAIYANSLTFDSVYVD